MAASLCQGELLTCTPWQFIWKQVIRGRCFENREKIVAEEGNRGVWKSLSSESDSGWELLALWGWSCYQYGGEDYFISTVYFRSAELPSLLVPFLWGDIWLMSGVLMCNASLLQPPMELEPLHLQTLPALVGEWLRVRKRQRYSSILILLGRNGARYWLHLCSNYSVSTLGWMGLSIGLIISGCFGHLESRNWGEGKIYEWY